MKKFFILWSSQAASLFGSAVVNFALAWHLTRETGSATILATALMMAMIPPIILGPLVGPLIDRWSRKKIMIFSDAFISLLTVVLVILFFTETIQVWHIYVILIGRSIGETFQHPALAASVPMIVPREQLTRANGFLHMLQYSVRIIAPAAGAFLVETLPMQWVLSVDIITAIIANGCLIPLVIPQPASPTIAATTGYFANMKLGFQYVWSRPGLVMLFGMMAVLMFSAAAPAFLMPVLVSEHLEGDVIKLGWMSSAQGIGAICGGLLLGVWGGLKKKIRTSLLGFAICIPCSILIGFTSVSIFYTTTIAALIFLGIGNAFVNISNTSITNLVVAKEIQGRVFSLYGSVVSAAIPLGLLVGGLLGDALGIRSVYWIAAAAWLFILPLAALSKPLMNLENQKAEEAPAPEIPPLTAR